MDYLASNYEVLIKTEPFLRFKKDLFKKLYGKCSLDEEVLRRKFYKFLDCYLHGKEINKKDFKDIKVNFLMKQMDDKFKKKKEGSFVVQGNNIGYRDNGNIKWVRYYDTYSSEDIKSYLDVE